jgi:hypothetical protein
MVFEKILKKLISGSGAYQQISLIFAEFENFELVSLLRQKQFFDSKCPYSGYLE